MSFFRISEKKNGAQDSLVQHAAWALALRVVLVVKLLQQSALLQVVKKPALDELLGLYVFGGRHCFCQVVKSVLHARHVNVGSLFQNLSDIKIVSLLEEKGIFDLGVSCDGLKGQFSVGSGAVDASRISAHEFVNQLRLSFHDASLHDQRWIRKGEVHVGDANEFFKTELVYHKLRRRRDQPRFDGAPLEAAHDRTHRPHLQDGHVLLGIEVVFPESIPGGDISGRSKARHPDLFSLEALNVLDLRSNIDGKNQLVCGIPDDLDISPLKGGGHGGAAV